MSDSFYFGTPDGHIEAPGEIDAYGVYLEEGVSYTAVVYGASTGGGDLWDPAALLFDEYGTPLGGQDDSPYAEHGLDPVFEFAAPYSGVFYLGVADLYGGTGSYVAHLAEAYAPGETGTGSYVLA